MIKTLVYSIVLLLVISCGRHDMYDYCGHSRGLERVEAMPDLLDFCGVYKVSEKTKNEFRGFEMKDIYLK